MCDLLLAFRGDPEPEKFGIPHGSVRWAQLQLDGGLDVGALGRRLNAWGDGHPLYINPDELKYAILDVCETYEAEVRRAAERLPAAPEPQAKELSS